MKKLWPIVVSLLIVFGSFPATAQRPWEPDESSRSNVKKVEQTDKKREKSRRKREYNAEAKADKKIDKLAKHKKRFRTRRAHN